MHDCEPPSLMRRRFLSGQKHDDTHLPDISWHGLEIDKPNWNDPEARVLAFTLAAAAKGGAHLHVMLNMSDSQVEMELPPLRNMSWHMSIDTSKESPQDAVDPEDRIRYKRKYYTVEPKSVVVMESSVSKWWGF